MSSNPEIAQQSAADWLLRRSYASYEEMAAAEPKLADGIDFVIVATPNHMHFPVVKVFLEHGINVVCDKPLSFSLEEAQELVKLVESKKLVFALTHNYTGYPMVKQARYM